MSKFYISILLSFWSIFLFAQKEKDSLVINDTILEVEKTPIKIRVGFDVGKFVLAQLKDSQSVDFTVDVNYKKYFGILEIGAETRNIDTSLLKYDVKGNYFRLGFDYDLYDNWTGMDNNITLGLRYGYAKFDSHLYSYTINQPNNIWQPVQHTVSIPFNDLSANWIEVVSKVQVETFKNLYLGYSISFKYLLNTTELDTFEVGYIPGFFNKNSLSNIGFGMQYVISYKFDF